MKKLFSLILTLSMLVGIFGTLAVSAATDLPFTDVKADDWFYEYIKEAYEEGIMQGKSSDTFDPEAQTTRAEFVKVLCAMSGDDYLGKGANLTFIDVEKGKWYMDYVGWGVENDIVKGLSGNKLGPDQPVTRQEMAVFIDRFVKYLDKKLPTEPKIDAFKDANEIESWATESVELMRLSGIITGVGNGYFKPQDNASRAEIATVITRLLPVINNDGTKPGDDIPVVDPVIPDKTGEFVFFDEDEAPISYYLYIPEGYSLNIQYPLVIYNRDNGAKSINTVDVLFSNKESPVYESIVLVPNINKNSDYKKVDELIRYVNSFYQTDKERIYMIALNDNLSTFETWNMMIDNPEIISAVIFVHGISATLGTSTTGQAVLADDIAFNRLPKSLKDIPISIVHCLDDNRPIGAYLDKNYGSKLYSALEFSGFKNISLTETTGYPDIYDTFISENDMTLLGWLFNQRRETK